MKTLFMFSVLGLLVFSGCVFSEDEVQYSYFRHVRELDFNAAQVFDRGFYGSDSVILEPIAFSADGFYLVESPDDLDYHFSACYPNKAFFENLFPQGGMLLIHITDLGNGWIPDEHRILTGGNTVTLDESVFLAYPDTFGEGVEVYSIIGIVPAR